MRLEIRMASLWRYKIITGQSTVPVSFARLPDKTQLSFDWTDSTRWRLEASVGTGPATIFLNDTPFATATYAGSKSLFTVDWEWHLEDRSGMTLYTHQYMTPRYRVRVQSVNGDRLAFMKMGCLKMWMIYRPSFAQLAPLLVLMVLKHACHDSGLD